MSPRDKTPDELLAENEELRSRLEEAEATLAAISGGEVDAFLIRHGTEDEEKVLVLGGVDRPYRLLIERMNQGAVTLTSDGVVVYANRRLTEMLGVSLQELVGVELGRFIPGSNRLALAGVLEKGLAGDAEVELTLEKRDGTTLPVLLTASRLLDEADVLCVILTDLRQKKRQEAARERLLQERTAREAAEQTTAVLREADRRKDEFLAMLAHELRNPLAPLRNGLQVLNLVGSQEAAAQKTREMMNRQVENLVRLVDDLLDVSRVSRGKLQLHKKVIDLKVVVLLAVENCRAFIDDRRHQLQLSLPEAPLPVEVDPLRLSQVVVNLLNNAAKFTPRGGRIGLTLEAGAGADASNVAVLRVRDSGIGIAPEMLPKIFDLFIQADPTVSRAEGGLGIGLTLVRSLVEMHGGKLHAASDGLGRGSEITVRLPLSRQEGEAGTAPRKSPERRRLPPGRRRSASWWSTTTATPVRVSPSCCASWATTSARSGTGRTRWRRRRSSSPTSSCSTSACRG